MSIVIAQVIVFTGIALGAVAMIWTFISDLAKWPGWKGRQG